MSTQVAVPETKMRLGLCVPCKSRKRTTLATQIVAGEEWCEGCSEESSSPVLKVPSVTVMDEVWKRIRTLEEGLAKTQDRVSRASSRIGGIEEALAAPPPPPIGAARVLEIVSVACRLPVESIVGPSHVPRCVCARSIGMTLLRQRGWSLQRIAIEFRRHHTTIHHDLQVAEKRRATDPSFDALVTRLAKQMGDGK